MIDDPLRRHTAIDPEDHPKETYDSIHCEECGVVLGYTTNNQKKGINLCKDDFDEHYSNQSNNQ